MAQPPHPWARPRRECKRGPGRLYAAFEGGRINERGAGTGKCCLALERKDIPTRATKPRNHAGHKGTDPARALAGVPGSTGRNVARRPWGRGWGMRSGKTLKLEGWTGATAARLPTAGRSLLCCVHPATANRRDRQRWERMRPARGQLPRARDSAGHRTGPGLETGRDGHRLTHSRPTLRSRGSDRTAIAQTRPNCE